MSVSLKSKLHKRGYIIRHYNEKGEKAGFGYSNLKSEALRIAKNSPYAVSRVFKASGEEIVK